MEVGLHQRQDMRCENAVLVRRNVVREIVYLEADQMRILLC